MGVSPLVAFRLTPTAPRFENLVGATTVVPPNQTTYDVFTAFKNRPMRTLFVAQGSPEDVALSSFPSLVERILIVSPSTHEEAVPVAIPASSGEVASGMGEYCGYTIRETSGVSSAVVILYDNTTTNSGFVLEEITLNPNETDKQHYPRPGRYVGNGIYAQITGSVEGSIFV